MNSTNFYICSQVTNFDFLTKYSMAFVESMYQISALYSHRLPRYEQFSTRGSAIFAAITISRTKVASLSPNIFTKQHSTSMKLHPNLSKMQSD